MLHENGRSFPHPPAPDPDPLPTPGMTRREEFLRAERTRVDIPAHGAVRVAVGYPNRYHVAQSSLSFQWVVQLAASRPGVGVERFFADQELRGATLESGAGLDRFHALAVSWAFEPDGANLLRILGAAGIPLRRKERSARHPLVVVGGAAASINPLPLSPAVDVFCLGAAERTLGTLLDLLLQEGDRETLLDDLASRDGFFVPSRHLDRSGLPTRRLRRLEKRDGDMTDAAAIPASYLVTPLTEYRRRSLIELSRGCPEKCRYCWVGHAYGRLRCHDPEDLIGRIGDLQQLGPRIGLVATALGDHPDLPQILEHCREQGLDVAVSSLRIPALNESVLRPLAACGARSITIAPETGSDELRLRLKKNVANDAILSGVETAQRCGLERLKMYFILGLPGESDGDVAAVAGLIRRARDISATWGRSRGRLATLHASVALLVPKPYTPYHREPMLPAAEARRRVGVVRRALRGVPNVRLDTPSYREALWQGYLAKAGSSAFGPLCEVARGTALSRVLADHQDEIRKIALARVEGSPPFHFISTAPTACSASAAPAPDDVEGRRGKKTQRRKGAKAQRGK